jgi:hypothetical protein
MKKRTERIGRMKAVEREYLVVKVALLRLQEALHLDPGLARDAEWEPADLRDALARLEARCVISRFAEFEAGLREVWRGLFRQAT